MRPSKDSTPLELWRLLLVILACCFLALPNCSGQQATHATVLVTLKIAKAPDSAASQPYRIRFEADCTDCSEVRDEIYCVQNVRELDFAVRVLSGRSVAINLDTDPRSVRRVLLEGTDLRFTKETDGVSFSVPAQSENRIFSAEYQTHLLYTGIDLRFEHADPARRNGDYATGAFPFTERAAAANLEFAQRDAAFQLGLGTYVSEQQIGQILLMGFDTNAPHGHTDFPPHMHMHMRWPERGGTQIGHYYISPQGLLLRNVVAPTGWVGGHISPFLPGETFTTYDLRGRPVYSHTITQEGWLRLARPGAATCLIRPHDITSGFQTGAVLSCPGYDDETIQVEDDTALGLLVVHITRPNEIISERYMYDSDTAILTSSSRSIETGAQTR